MGLLTLFQWPVLCHNFSLYTPRITSCLTLRYIFSTTGTWEPEVTTEIKKEIEHYWSDKINPPQVEKAGQQPYYVLSMFPYPSGRLHLGHVRVYSVSDVIARFYRMRGLKVIHPIGWDAFGLPAENAAIDRGELPEKWTRSNIEAMKQQLKDLGISFDWDREIATCDPSYYKWTQLFFLQMFHKGLAYKAKAMVNWDPVDQTVLADEQVDVDGRSWRSGAKVEKKLLSQWFLRSTVFSEPLYNGLDEVDWKEVPNIQKNWIGDSFGYIFHFKLHGGDGKIDETINVWTENPELLLGATFLSLSPDHHLISSEFSDFQKVTDTPIERPLDLKAIHPFTGQLLPIFLTNTLYHPRASDSHIGIPGEIPEDKEFALRHNLPVIKVLNSSGTLINAGEFSGLSAMAAREQVVLKAKQMNAGGYKSSSRLKDWLISRQRYWGTPIPIIHCPSCKIVPVPFEDLPVLLPPLTTFSNKGASPLANAHDWLNISCPKCKGPATREVDTMDTFVDSTWYYLRYLDPHNSAAPFSPDKVSSAYPVDLYIGGKEHAALHLYFARLFAHFFHSLGLVKNPEPFKKLLMQGVIMGLSYRIKGTSTYLPFDQVGFSALHPFEKETKRHVVTEWEKMSKSKHNGIDPETLIEKFGVDTTRLFVLESASPLSDRRWLGDNYDGILRWQHRLWLIITELRSQKDEEPDTELLSEKERQEYISYLYDRRNYYVAGVTESLGFTHNLRVTVTKIEGLSKSIRRVSKSLKKGLELERSIATLIIMLGPLAPHFASELWAGFTDIAEKQPEYYDVDKPLMEQKWPEIDKDYKVNLYIKINGVQSNCTIRREDLDVLNEEQAIRIALSTKHGQQYSHGAEIQDVNFSVLPGCAAELNIKIKNDNNQQPEKETSAV